MCSQNDTVYNLINQCPLALAIHLDVAASLTVKVFGSHFFAFAALWMCFFEGKGFDDFGFCSTMTLQLVHLHRISYKA